jgi:hypothetical protein
MEVYLHAFLTSALDGGEFSVSRPGRFTPEDIALDIYWIREWMGPQSRSGRGGEEEKPLLLSEIHRQSSIP